MQACEAYYQNGRVIPVGNPQIPEGCRLIITFLDETAMPSKTSRESFFGCMKGKIWMSDDFDEPLEEMKEYME